MTRAIDVIDQRRIRALTEAAFDALGSVPDTTATEIGSAIANVVALLAVTLEQHNGEPAAAFVDRLAASVKDAIARAGKPDARGVEA
jgi:hypothetical protein